MATTHKLIESYTVGSGGVSSVTLGSGGTIPQTYTDLLVLWSQRNITSNNFTGVYFNGVKTNFTNKQANGDGQNLGAYNRTDTYVGGTDGSNWTANTFGNSQIYIPNYTSSNYKPWFADVLGENNGTYANQTLVGGLWSNTAAITSISFDDLGGLGVDQYSTFYLYGIKNS